MAEIHDVIERLPQGYQTVIGEHGVGLSGGQKQRIAIARALLKRPRMLIFDEATSNLDVETSEHFARTINQLKGSTTILFITHHVPRGLAVDAIVRLGDQGRPLAEPGTRPCACRASCAPAARVRSAGWATGSRPRLLSSYSGSVSSGCGPLGTRVFPPWSLRYTLLHIFKVSDRLTDAGRPAMPICGTFDRFGRFGTTV